MGSPDAGVPGAGPPVAEAAGGGPLPGFAADGAWCLHPQVALRPEPFGALLYHFGTRRLSFLKAPGLAAVVRALGDYPSARAAIEACGEREAGLIGALSTLATTGMIVRRER